MAAIGVGNMLDPRHPVACPYRVNDLRQWPGYEAEFVEQLRSFAQR